MKFEDVCLAKLIHFCVVKNMDAHYIWCKINHSQKIFILI
jgi:hypothetical protein